MWGVPARRLDDIPLAIAQSAPLKPFIESSLRRVIASGGGSELFGSSVAADEVGLPPGGVLFWGIA